MGSNHALSNGNEPGELTDLLRGFERANTVSLSIHIVTSKRAGKDDLLVSGIAIPVMSDTVAAKYLGSANALCWGSDFKSLMGLATTLLYKLDFQLGENEFRKLPEKE